MNFSSQILGFFQHFPGRLQVNTSDFLLWCFAFIAASHVYPAITFGAGALPLRENLTIFYSANNLGETEPGG